MPGIFSVETMGLHMHPQDSMKARVKVLRNFSREELQRALDLATACSLTFPGYGYRRTVMTIRTTLEAFKEKTR